MLHRLITAVAAVVIATPALAGNGAPSGPHYNLNILGKDHCSPASLTDSNRHTIEVKLTYSPAIDGETYATVDRTNTILLQQGDVFQVLDGNACDKGGAAFQLPLDPFGCDPADPTCAAPDFQSYLVYARALGKPGGSATMTTCTTGAGLDGVLGTADDEVICSTENVVMVRNKGRSTFDDVTKELTTVVADFDGDGKLERMGIFSDPLRYFLWDYDNNGLRLAQLRFYPLPD